MALKFAEELLLVAVRSLDRFTYEYLSIMASARSMKPRELMALLMTCVEFVVLLTWFLDCKFFYFYDSLSLCGGSPEEEFFSILL